MIVVCSSCSKSFNKDPYRVKKCRTHYCSNECTKTGKLVDCPTCRNQFYVSAAVQRSGKGIYCSKKCNHVGLSVRYKDEGSPSWKEGKLTYSGIHAWVRRKKGAPKKCELCGDTEKGYYEWANKSGNYLRDLEDWIRMCKKCHNDYDGVNAWQNKSNTARQVG